MIRGKETYKYLGILEADTIKHVEIKGKILQRVSHGYEKITGYDIKQSDGEGLAILGLCGMQSTPSLPSLPGPLSLGMVAPDRVLSMGKKRTVWHLNWVQKMTHAKLNG